ncbi:MAG: hypothetical protein IJD26_04145, partial [Lachnospiraceae bacterium]|nr:hypothetical protein [Lachnospiraceae bacterium]
MGYSDRERSLCGGYGKSDSFKIEEISLSDTAEAFYEEYFFKNVGQEGKWYCVGVVSAIPGVAVTVTFTDISDDVVATQRFKRRA